MPSLNVQEGAFCRQVTEQCCAVKRVRDAKSRETSRHANGKGESVAHLSGKWRNRKMNKLIVTAFLIIACHSYTSAQTAESTSVETDTQNVSVTEKTHAETLNAKLIACVKSGDANCVKHALAAGADVNADDEEKNGNGLVLNFALRQENKRIAQALIESGANINQHEKQTGDTPLMMVATRGDVFWTRELISRGAKVDEESGCGDTALVEAVVAMTAVTSPQLTSIVLSILSEEDKEELKFGTEDDYIKVIKLLLDNGADANHVTQDCGTSPFYWVVASGNVTIAKLFLERGATIRDENSMWQEISVNDKEIAKSLKENKENPEESKAMLEWFKATRERRKQIKKLIEDAKAKR